MKLQQALVLVQFLRQCDEVMFWINDKETFVTTDEFGHDLEHVEVLQRKFDEFQKDMVSQEYRVTEVNELADKLVVEGHPERDTILSRKEVRNADNFKWGGQVRGLGTFLSIFVMFTNVFQICI
jgi:spectrin alpha